MMERNKWLMWMLIGMSLLILNWTIVGCCCIIYAMFISDDSDGFRDAGNNRLK
jgi:hypothetical protein